MATGRLPDPNTAPLTAKGDLYTYSTVPARLAVGSNGDTLVADSSATTGLRWQADWNTGKNKIINGDFGIWQRGTSFSPASAVTTFTADRFSFYPEGSGATRTVSQQTFTPGTAPVSGYEGRFFLRYAQSVGPSGAIGNNLMINRIEDVRSLAGQTVTISFWAKAASNMTLPLVQTVQNFGTGGSPSSQVSTNFATDVSITTSWTRYSYTGTVPSISGKTIGTDNNSYLDVRFGFPLGAGATFTFDTWGWQIEAGSVATPFTTATGTLAGELAACQRYAWAIDHTNSETTSFMNGIAISATEAVTNVIFPVTMRTKPTLTVTGTTNFLILFGSYQNRAAVTLALNTGINQYLELYTTVSGGLTAGNAVMLGFSGASQTQKLLFSAEL